MPGFPTIGPGWHVEDLQYVTYRIYTVWSAATGRLLGVAGGADALDDLLEACASAEMRRLQADRVRFRVVRLGPGPRAKPRADRHEAVWVRAVNGQPGQIEVKRLPAPAPRDVHGPARRRRLGRRR